MVEEAEQPGQSVSAVVKKYGIHPILGKKTMEVEILKDAIEIACEKNCCREGHAEKLVPASEAFDLVIAVVSCNAFAKFVGRKEFH